MPNDARGGLLLAGEDTREPRQVAVGQGEVWVHTQSSPARTTPNEDAVLVFERADSALVLAVADGLGGMAGGAAASRAALEALAEVLADADAVEALRGPILDGFEAANEAVREIGGGAGTTLVVAEVVGAVLRTYHVGDSAALVVGQRGRQKLATISHSPVGYGVAAGLIEPDDAVVHEDLHYLSNHLGTAEMRIEVGSPLKLAARDTLLVASDGVLDNLLPRELVDDIRTGPLREVAPELARRVAERMESGSLRDAPSKPDDATFLLHRRAAHARRARSRRTEAAEEGRQA